MKNEDYIQQLMFRCERIKHLIALQKSPALRQLLAAEQLYVEAMIEYRERHGGITGLITDDNDQYVRDAIYEPARA